MNKNKTPAISPNIRLSKAIELGGIMLRPVKWGGDFEMIEQNMVKFEGCGLFTWHERGYSGNGIRKIGQ